ncbi:hypothetical protein J4424_04230, partial [Candidatus Woesearchaeota archaeon]|nr:hypothetical protein [Candidatus Woesearchaeota archaeon]
MAAPHVSGVILLMQQYKESVEGRNLSSSEVNTTLATNGTSIDDSDGSGRSFVRLDAKKAIIAIDNLNPNILLFNTSEQNISTAGNTTFIANVTDINIENVWVEGNWSGAYQNITLTNNVNSQYNQTLKNNCSIVGTFQWRVNANDSKPNFISSNWINSTIRSTPIVTLNNPQNLTLTNNISTIFNYSATDCSSTINCSLIINNQFNTSINTTNATLTEFKVNLSEGTNNWNIECNNTQGNLGYSSTRTIILDTTSPTFNAEGYSSLVELGDNQSYSINLTDT